MNDIINTYNEVVSFENSDIDNFMESLRYNKRGIIISTFLNELKNNKVPFLYIRSFNHTSKNIEFANFTKLVISTDHLDKLENITIPEGIELNINKNIEVNCLL